MTKNPTIVPPSTTLNTIQSIFYKNNFWSVYVGDSDRFLGIITRKDLHIRGKGVGPSSRADSIMSRTVLTLDENSDVNEAIRIIKQKKINGLGVTKNGKPCGIVTKADIKKRYHQNAFENYENSDVKRNQMTLCNFCGEKIKEILPWECSYCHRVFCSNHRLPEYHSCPGLKGPISNKDAIKNLLFLLKNENSDQRKKAAILLDGRNWIPPTDNHKASYYFARQDWDTLISLGTPAYELLIAGLQDKDIKIRISCARSLGILGNPDAIHPLLQIVYQDGTPHLLRNEIATALGNLGWSPKTDSEKISFLIAQQQWRELIPYKEKIISPISVLFDDANEDIRIKAAELLCELHDNRTFGILKNALKDRSKKVRITALNGIISLKTPENIDAFIIALNDESEEIRIKATECLCELRDKRTIGNLKVALNDSSKKVRITALKGIIDLKDSENVDTLIIGLNDSDFAIQRLALDGLIQSDTLAVDALISTAKKIEEKNPDRFEMINKIIFALGEIQDERAREFLIKIHENTKVDSTRNIVQEAINKIDLQSNNLKQKSKLYCLNCFSNFIKNKQIIIPFINSSTVPVCRNCKSNKNYLENVEKVVLLLDDMNVPYRFKNNILSVNWFDIKRPIDLHEIAIIKGTNEDIAELVMKFKNDNDAERKKTYKHIPILIEEDLNISQAKINLLQNTFGNVHVVEKDTINK